MAGENAKIYFPQGADRLRLEDGASVEIEAGETDIVLKNSAGALVLTGLPTASAGLGAGTLFTASGALRVKT